jgi:PBP1b-binding outer membrane lipoprotein LpoB
MTRLLTVGLVGLLLTACGTTRDTRVDPDAADTVTGTGLQSVDIRTMADRMAKDLKAFGVLAPSREGDRLSFFIYEMENRSSDPIDKKIILTKLRTNLFRAFQGRVRILDRSASANDLVDAERRMKERGEVSGENNRKVAGSDFVLKGVIQSRDRQAAKLRSSYVLVTFELTDLVTGELVWTGDYEMKTESERSVINR